MPSVSSSVMSWLEHFLQLVALFLLLLAHPTLLPLPFRLHVLVLPFVRGLAASWFFSAVLLCLPSLWPILDLLLPSFFLLPFRCSVLIVQCLWFRFPVSRAVLCFGGVHAVISRFISIVFYPLCYFQLRGGVLGGGGLLSLRHVFSLQLSSEMEPLGCCHAPCGLLVVLTPLYGSCIPWVIDRLPLVD